MAGYVGFQLAFELTNVLPIREILKATPAYIMSLARNLRKSGSDLIVEMDLAEVFGRVNISSELETKFKETIRIQRSLRFRKEKSPSKQALALRFNMPFSTKNILRPWYSYHSLAGCIIGSHSHLCFPSR